MSMILILILILMILSIKYDYSEKFSNNDKSIKWTTDEKCQYKMMDVLENSLTKMNGKKSDINWDFYLPCSYNTANSELENISDKTGKKIFIIDGCDNLA